MAEPQTDDAAKQEIVVAGDPRGRPSSYSKSIADEICRRLADDEGLAAICRDDHMPDRNTVYRWKRDIPAFRDSYAHARENQAHTVVDKMGDVRADVAAGKLDPAAARVIADIIKWEASRRAPKDFGDKLDVTSSDGSMSPPKSLAEFYAKPE